MFISIRLNGKKEACFALILEKIWIKNGVSL